MTQTQVYFSLRLSSKIVNNKEVFNQPEGVSEQPHYLLRGQNQR